MYTCPRCKKETISWKKKYLAGLWLTIGCDNCEAKLSATPILLGLLHVVYAWNIAWFFSLYYFQRDPTYFVYMVVIWGILDALNVHYIPLSVMKKEERT